MREGGGWVYFCRGVVGGFIFVEGWWVGLFLLRGVGVVV